MEGTDGAKSVVASEAGEGAGRGGWKQIGEGDGKPAGGVSG